ncbi:MAG: hydroxysqualene dehydroxylase HpnE [Geminicoccaceae bacterium]
MVGAGVAGLSAALELAERGRKVLVHEMAPGAGGRCRSFADTKLGRSLDNGNHLILSGNHAVLAVLDRIGARERWIEVAPARFPFLDVRSATAWRFAPSPGLWQGWIFSKHRRVPDTGPTDYLALVKFLFAGADATVEDVVPRRSALHHSLIEPLCLAVLNAAPAQGAAGLMGRVIRETILRGERFCRPLIAREGLGHGLIDPLTHHLRTLGAEIAFGQRLRAIEFDETTARRLLFRDGDVELDNGDRVVLATPPAVTAKLVDGLDVPLDQSAILNLHFLADTDRLDQDAPFLGLIGSKAQWLFWREGLISVTISAADDALMGLPDPDLAAMIWAEINRALDLGVEAVPPCRVVRERRATFHQTPPALKSRPEPATRYTNLMLGGDWTDTGLPATIEGAVRSGRTAANAVLRSV